MAAISNQYYNAWQRAHSYCARILSQEGISKLTVVIPAVNADVVGLRLCIFGIITMPNSSHGSPVIN